MNNPPPGSYQPKYDFMYKTEASWGFGGSERKQPRLTQSPSMQAYTLPSMAFDKRSFVMGKKLGASFIDKGSDGPGPGNYEPNFRATVSNLPMYTLKGRYKGKEPM